LNEAGFSLAAPDGRASRFLLVYRSDVDANPLPDQARKMGGGWYLLKEPSLPGRRLDMRWHLFTQLTVDGAAARRDINFLGDLLKQDALANSDPWMPLYARGPRPLKGG